MCGVRDNVPDHRDVGDRRIWSAACLSSAEAVDALAKIMRDTMEMYDPTGSPGMGGAGVRRSGSSIATWCSRFWICGRLSRGFKTTGLLTNPYHDIV